MTDDAAGTPSPQTARAVEDRFAIHDLTARYNRAADGTDVDALLALFTPDAVVEMHGRGDGPASYEGPAISGLVAPFAGQRVHLTTDAIVQLDGDRATQTCTLLLCTRSRSRGVAALFTGRYDDELVRTEAGWLFARRVVHIDYANEGRMPLASAAEVQA